MAFGQSYAKYREALEEFAEMRRKPASKQREGSSNETEAFYDENAQYEWERLDRHRTEFAVTMRVLKDYLVSPPVDVL